MFLRRRRLIATTTGLAAASLGLPRIAIGQADRRPSITIAVQQIANSASLEPLREQSNVGQRVFSFLFEPLIMQNLLGKLEAVPGVAESWKRIDDRTVEFTLRKGVKFHNGDELRPTTWSSPSAASACSGRTTTSPRTRRCSPRC